jgi:hypothetical protein
MAENDINQTIENDLICNNDHYYIELQEYFENYIIENDLISENETIEQGYYKYLISILERGTGLDKIKNNVKTKSLKDKIYCSGYNLTRKGNIDFMEKWFKPTIEKYKLELIKENKDKDIIFRLGTYNLSDETDATIVLNGILNMYEPSDFKRPILKKIVILDWFVPLELNK